ncbi:MAG: TetR family transcriptional regulator [Rhizobiales bacterium]|nr:TetR family transcriptional regulator [Hyphomicrobiales bacterium]
MRHMTSGSPKTRQRAPQKRAEETRQRLLAAAIEMFTTVGFEGVMVATLEEVAEVQRGLLTYHFGSKEALWQQAVDYTFNSSEAATRKFFVEELAKRDGDQLAALIAAYIRSSARYPELLNFIMREATVDSDRRDYMAEKHVSRFADAVSNVNDRPKSVFDFYAIIGAMSFVFVSPAGARRIWETEPFSDAFVEQHIDSIITLFRHGWSAADDE